MEEVPMEAHHHHLAPAPEMHQHVVEGQPAGMEAIMNAHMHGQVSIPHGSGLSPAFGAPAPGGYPPSQFPPSAFPPQPQFAHSDPHYPPPQFPPPAPQFPQGGVPLEEHHHHLAQVPVEEHHHHHHAQGQGGATYAKAFWLQLDNEATAHHVLQRALAGENFSDLARQFSTDEDCRETGGDCGEPLTRDADLDPAFLELCFSAPINVPSGPVMYTDEDNTPHWALALVVQRW